MNEGPDKTCLDHEGVLHDYDFGRVKDWVDPAFQDLGIL